MQFIHTADIHLGASPDADMPWGEERKEEVWATFRRLIDRVRTQKPELLLIAGDLFHAQPLKRELKEVNAMFASIPDTQIVLIAGNHDHLQDDGYYQNYAWCGNVHGLWSREWGRVYLESLDTYVYGLSYYEREIRQKLYNFVFPDAAYPQARHILLAHGGDEKHIPFDVQKLIAAGFDYVAAGHIHKPQILVKNRAAFCGALEPLDRNDTGQHGFIEGEFEGKSVTLSFVPFACRSYRVLPVETDRETTQFTLRQKIANAIREAGERDIYKIQVLGYRDPDMSFRSETLLDAGNIVEIDDETRPDYDLDQLLATYEGSLIGAYIRHFQQAEKTELNQRALDYGLGALLNTLRTE